MFMINIHHVRNSLPASSNSRRFWPRLSREGGTSTNGRTAIEQAQLVIFLQCSVFNTKLSSRAVSSKQFIFIVCCIGIVKSTLLGFCSCESPLLSFSSVGDSSCASIVAKEQLSKEVALICKRFCRKLIIYFCQNQELSFVYRYVQKDYTELNLAIYVLWFTLFIYIYIQGNQL